MSVPVGFRRVKKDCACPVCARPDWCLVSVDDPPSKAICKRVASPRPWGEAGYFHRLRDDGWRPARSAIRTLRIGAAAGVPDLTDVADAHCRAVEPESLEQHAAHLGVTVARLRRLRIGRAGHPWSFPMLGADGRVCGIRLRLPDGRKWSVQGGKEGIFVPADLDASGVLGIAEGPTDCAALLDLGLEAVGRPNCSGGVALLVALVGTRRPRAIVIFADADGPGQAGAISLAATLTTRCRDVRLVTPPAKDVRAWLQQGATPAHALELIQGAPVRRMAVRVLGRFS